MRKSKLTPREVHEIYASPRIQLARKLEDLEATDGQTPEPEPTVSDKIKALQLRVMQARESLQRERDRAGEIKAHLDLAVDHLRKLQGEELED